MFNFKEIMQRLELDSLSWPIKLTSTSAVKKGGLPLWEVLVTLGSSTTGPLILLGPLKHIVYLMHLKL